MTTNEEILEDYETYCKKTGNRRYMFDDEIKRGQTLLLMQKARQDEARKIFADEPKAEGDIEDAEVASEYLYKLIDWLKAKKKECGVE